MGEVAGNTTSCSAKKKELTEQRRKPVIQEDLPVFEKGIGMPEEINGEIGDACHHNSRNLGRKCRRLRRATSKSRITKMDNEINGGKDTQKRLVRNLCNDGPERLSISSTPPTNWHATSSLRNAAKRRVLDTATCVPESCDRAVVRPTCELLLHRLRQRGPFDIRILRRLGSKFTIEVGRVTGVNLRGFSLTCRWEINR